MGGWEGGEETEIDGLGEVVLGRGGEEVGG